MSDSALPADLVNLPWSTQLTLAGGYASYLLCYVGIRAWHTAVDTIFYTLVFGLAVGGTHYLLVQNHTEFFASAVAFGLGCLCGVLWRLFGRPVLRCILRETNVSWIDDDPSALASVITDSKHRMTQIAVQLDDGSWLRCDDLSLFVDSPMGPCKIGPSGDVSMYLTHTEASDGTESQIAVIDKDFGDKLTYVPSAKIKRINLRHLR